MKKYEIIEKQQLYAFFETQVIFKQYKKNFLYLI